MEGDLAKLPEIVALAQRYNAVTIVDDSHGTGVMGQTGRGTVEHYGLTGKIDIITGTLGKALGGAAGGFVAGSEALIDTLIQRSRTAAVLQRACRRRSRAARWRRSKSSTRIPNCSRSSVRTSRYFRERLGALGFKPLDGESAIMPIIVGETAFAIAMSERLLREGVFVTGFGFPVVPEGTARIRVQISAALEREHLDKALAAFEKVGTELGLLPVKTR